VAELDDASIGSLMVTTEWMANWRNAVFLVDSKVFYIVRT